MFVCDVVAEMECDLPEEDFLQQLSSDLEASLQATNKQYRSYNLSTIVNQVHNVNTSIK